MPFEDFQLQNQSLSRQIADKIQAMVTSRELLPGHKLPSERQLAEQLQVSRNVIREATALLEERGVVSIHIGSGIYISEISADALSRSVSLFVKRKGISIAQLFEIRWILEVENARLAAFNATPEEVAAMEKTIIEMENHPDNLEIFTIADINFHELLAYATHNPLLPVLLETISEPLHKQALIATALPGANENAIKHHRNIFRAIRSKSGTLARSAMTKHLASAWDYLLEAVKDPQEVIGEMRFADSDLNDF
jgi:GntR family transcriptional regulator, transcriptional repressor for pyruvate dehydrogenase complex